MSAQVKFDVTKYPGDQAYVSLYDTLVYIDGKQYKNFLAETNYAISHSGRTWDDIAWIGSKKSREVYDMDRFRRLARSINYLWSSDQVVISPDIVVVFHDMSQLQRTSSGGMEEWEYIPRRLYKVRDVTLTLDDLLNTCE